MAVKKTNLSLPVEVRRMLEALAKAGHRTKTQQIILLIEREYAASMVPPSTPAP